MVFASTKNDCGMVVKWFLDNKKRRRKKRRPKQNEAIKTQVIKRPDNSKYADERRIMGRFAKRVSGERPISLGFELTFLSEF